MRAFCPTRLWPRPGKSSQWHCWGKCLAVCPVLTGGSQCSALLSVRKFWNSGHFQIQNSLFRTQWIELPWYRGHAYLCVKPNFDMARLLWRWRLNIPQPSPSRANSSLRNKSLALRCTKKGFPRRYIYISKARSFLLVGLKIPYPYIAYFCVVKSFLRLTVREKMKYGMREMVKEQISCWRI